MPAPSQASRPEQASAPGELQGVPAALGANAQVKEGVHRLRVQGFSSSQSASAMHSVPPMEEEEEDCALELGGSKGESVQAASASASAPADQNGHIEGKRCILYGYRHRRGVSSVVLARFGKHRQARTSKGTARAKKSENIVALRAASILSCAPKF